MKNKEYDSNYKCKLVYKAIPDRPSEPAYINAAGDLVERTLKFYGVPARMKEPNKCIAHHIEKKRLAALNKPVVDLVKQQQLIAASLNIEYEFFHHT